MYTGQLDHGQIHDFNPGFGPAVDPNGSNGFGDRVFWTVPIPDSDVSVNFGAGRAEMKVDNLTLGDYFTKPNAFGPNWATNFVGATASFDVLWSAPVTRRLDFQDATNVDQFSGTYVEDQASVTWSASNANGFSFTANPGDLTTSFNGFAELAHEQNGIFDASDSSATDSAIARSLAQTMPAKPLQGAVATPIWAILPSAGQTAAPVVTSPHSTSPAIGADPGGSDSTDGSNQLGDALFR